MLPSQDLVALVLDYCTSVGQNTSVLAKLAYVVILYCAACSAAAPGVTRTECWLYMGLCVCVWYGDVQCQRFAFDPREESGDVPSARVLSSIVSLTGCFAAGICARWLAR